MPESLSLLRCTENTRDLGGHRAEGGHITRYHALLRSDVPKNIGEQDIADLRKRRITTIVDMREEAAIRRDGSALAHVEGFTYCPCPIPEGSGIPASPAAVPESYMVIAESKGMEAVFHTIADTEGGVLFHCTAGKDRTGVVSAVLLSLCGVDEQEIVEDYVLTATCIRRRLEDMHRNFPQIDMTVVTPAARYMEGFLSLLRSKYGSAEGYLRSIGLSEGEIDALRKKLL